MRLRQRDALAYFPARALRRFDGGQGPMVLLHDHLDVGQHRVDIAGKFATNGPAPAGA